MFAIAAARLILPAYLCGLVDLWADLMDPTPLIYNLKLNFMTLFSRADQGYSEYRMKYNKYFTPYPDQII